VSGTATDSYGGSSNADAESDADAYDGGSRLASMSSGAVEAGIWAGRRGEPKKSSSAAPCSASELRGESCTRAGAGAEIGAEAEVEVVAKEAIGR
jgi:hypothetical protein